MPPAYQTYTNEHRFNSSDRKNGHRKRNQMTFQFSLESLQLRRRNIYGPRQYINLSSQSTETENSRSQLELDMIGVVPTLHSYCLKTGEQKLFLLRTMRQLLVAGYIPAFSWCYYVT